MKPYSVIAVGTDGSQPSYGALDRAAALVADTGATMVIVCAYRPESREVVEDAQSAMGDDAYLVVGAQPAAQKLERASEHVAGVGVPEVRTVAAEGEPVDVLTSVAKDWKADLMVVGNRGLNSLGGRLLGSVPSGVLHKSPVDVLIVHTTLTGRRTTRKDHE